MADEDETWEGEDNVRYNPAPYNLIKPPVYVVNFKGKGVKLPRNFSFEGFQQINIGDSHVKRSYYHGWEQFPRNSVFVLAFTLSELEDLLNNVIGQTSYPQVNRVWLNCSINNLTQKQTPNLGSLCATRVQSAIDHLLVSFPNAKLVFGQPFAKHVNQQTKEFVKEMSDWKEGKYHGAHDLDPQVKVHLFRRGYTVPTINFKDDLHLTNDLYRQLSIDVVAKFGELNC